MTTPVFRSLARCLHHWQLSPPCSAPLLTSRYLTNTIVFPDRVSLLEWLPKNGVVAECGVNRGDFSAEILSHCVPQKLLLIDSWESRRYSERNMEVVLDRFENEISQGTVQVVRKRSVSALNEVPDGSLSWVYLDTTHDYHTTKDELKISSQKVAADGLIAGHDYTIGNWSRYLRYGVIEAVNEFCLTEGWGFAAITHEPDRHLSFALRKLK